MARWKQDYAGERYTETISVQLTPTQRATAEKRMARAHRRTLSDYFRWRGVEADEARPEIDPELVRQIEAQLRRAGNNLNQAVHHINATGHLRSQAEFEQCITDLKIAFARVISL
jgi:hypothetical protein